MSNQEHIDTDMDFFAGLELNALAEELNKSVDKNDETTLRLISGELARRISELTELKASCDDSIHKLEMKAFG